jgi:hypothetical protein
MSDADRMQLIARMGLSIGAIDKAIKEKEKGYASEAFVEFMGAAGMLAMEIDELDHSNGN